MSDTFLEILLCIVGTRTISELVFHVLWQNLCALPPVKTDFYPALPNDSCLSNTGQDGYNDCTEERCTNAPLSMDLMMPGFCVHGDENKHKPVFRLQLFYRILFICSFLTQKG